MAAISLGLVGSNPTASVLTNLTTGSASVKASINATLNTSLKSDLADVIGQGGYPALAGLLKEMPVVDVAANQNATLQAFLSAQLDPLVTKDPAMKQAVDQELTNISTTTTVGTLLNLNQSLQSHPLFTIGVNQAQLGELLSTNPALTSTQLQTDFINAYAASTGSMSDFWSQLGQNKEFTNLIPQIQLTLQLGAFSLNNTPLVAALQNTLKPTALRDLTTQLTTATLTNLITSNNIPVPAGIPGQTAANYASAMMSLLTAAFPTDFVAQSFQKSDPLNRGVATFLGNSPDFDLATTNVNSYLKQNSATGFKGIAADQVAAVTNRLLSVQRVFRVNSDPSVIQTLIGSGLDSARKVASIPQGVFMRQFTEALGGQSTALLVYNGARQIAGMVSSVYRTIKEALQQANPTAIGNSTPTLSNTLSQILPNWQTLFGSTSYCECDECNAMDGPAAYFVDLLQFLEGANTGSVAKPQNSSAFTPLDVLVGYQNNPNNYTWTINPDGTSSKGAMIPPPNNTPPVGRRPDLAYLKLTCANSDTPLPYVDLINEILESYVYYVGMKSQATLPASSNNTPSDASPEELSVNPEYTIPAVYSGPMVNAIYPFSIPYDRYLDTARIYLNFLGSSRYQLMRSFGVFTSTEDQLAMMAAESLSLSQTEYELISTASFELNTPAPAEYIYTAQNAYTFYGYSGASVTQPNSTGTVETLQWDQWLVQVPELLKRTGLAYTDLVSLLETEYLNPGQTLFIEFQNNTCNIDTALIVGATVTTVNITGKPTTGDVINLVVTSTALTGSPLEFSYTIAAPAAGAPASAGLDAAAASLAGQINANTTLNDASVAAVVSGAIITITVPSSLTPAPIWSSNVTTNQPGAATEIVAVTSTSSVADFFADLPPFLRLWRKSGWQMSELDKAITAMNTGGIDRSLVLAVSQLKQLETALNLPVSQLLSLWANVDADGRKSLYIQLFQNKTVINPLDPAFQLTYRASLSLSSAFPPLPAIWPDGTANQAVYDSANNLLKFPGTMTDTEQDNLLSWAQSNDSAILAIQNLFEQRWMAGTDIVEPTGQSPFIAAHLNTILAALEANATDLSAIAVDCGMIPPDGDLGSGAWALLGGTATPNDSVTLSMSYTSLGVSYPAISIAYTVKQGDTLASIAANLVAAINANATLEQRGVSATARGTLISLYYPLTSDTIISWANSTASTATESVAIATTPVLTLASLSSLYRYTVLAKALSLSIADLISLKALTGINPFAFAAGDPVTNNAFQFVQAAENVASSKFSVARLNYIYRAFPDVADGLPPLQSIEDQLAIGLSVGLQKIAAANAYTPDPSGTALQKKLAVLLPADQVSPTMNLINGGATYSSPLPTFPAGIALLSVASATIGGSATAGDKVTLTVASTAIAGSPITIAYSVVSNDTLSSIASQLASQVRANNALVTAGISASASGAVVTLFAPSSLNPNAVWSAGTAASTGSGTATETVTLSATLTFTFLSYATVGGNITVGDTVTLTMTSSAIAGSPVNVAYAVSAGDTIASIAANLAAAINSNSILSAAGIRASSSSGMVTLSAPSWLNPYPVWTASASPHAGGTATETVTLSSALALNGLMTYAVLTEQQQVSGASANQAFLSAVSNIYNQSQLILSDNLYFLAPDQIYSTQLNEFPLSVPLPTVPPGQVTFAINATVGGALTTGDQITLTMTPPAGLGSAISATYLVAAGDSKASIAANLATLINSTPAFPAAGVVASASGFVIVFESGSLNPVWSASQSAAATETVTFSGTLASDGAMSNSTLVELLKLTGASSAFTAAANALYNQAWNVPAQTLSGASAESGYNYVIGSLLEYLRSTQSQSLVKQTLSQALCMDSTLIALLLEGDPTTGTPALLGSNAIQTSPAEPAITDFLGGLLANYYSGTNLTGHLQTQIDPGINLDGTELAFSSAQWSGRIVPPTTDTYTFGINVPAGAPTGGQVKLWVNDQLVIDTVDTPNVQVSINLITGQIYDFQMIFVNAPTTAPYQFQLQWETTSASAAAIPSTAFVLGADPSSAVLMETSFTQSSPSFVLGGIYSTLSLLNRIAALVNGFSMQTNDVAYLSAHKTDFQGVDPGNSNNTVPFDLSLLPLDYFSTPLSQTGGNPNQAAIDKKAVAFFNQWQRLNNLYRLMASLPSGNTTLFGVFAAASQSGKSSPPVSQAVVSTVLETTNWNATDFNSLIGPSGFGLADVNLKNERWLVQIAACLAWVNRLGISALQLLNWANNSPDVTQAQNIINTVKAKYSDSVWVTIGKPLNDKIREHSKDALIAYILNMAPIVQLGFTDADDLYDYVLIDVQMCTCMITSRIVQATAAVQQFVQRCLLNLENGNSNLSLNVSPSAIDATEWENWRKNYRVWQAAVEVFLYPENWVDPTLRDNRTPFFLDLQNQLMQSSITQDNAQAAYLAYLEDLRQVARLEMMGTYNQVDPTSGINVTHVFGRTYSSPHVYFYRSLDNNLGVWSPWQKMDVDISGDQLIPVVWNNRLYVFWPNYKEITDPSDTSAAAPSINTSGGVTTIGAATPATKTLHVTMSWSEYRQGAWTKKQTTPEAAPLIPNLFSAYSMNLNTTQFSFWPAQYDANLTIWMAQNVSLALYSYPPKLVENCNPCGGFVFTGSRANLAGAPFPYYGDPTSAGYYHQYLSTSLPTWEPSWEPVNMGAQYQSDATDLTLEVVAVPATASQAPVLNPVRVLQTAANNPIPQGYTLMFPAQLGGFVPLTVGSPNFFFQDMQRTFYVTEERQFVIRQFTNASSATFFNQLQASESDFQITAPVFETKGAAIPNQPTSLKSSPAIATGGASSRAAITTELGSDQYLPGDQWQYYFQGTYLLGTHLRFANHYHPWVDEFIRLTNWQSIPLLLDTTTQQLGLEPDPNDPSNTSNLFSFQSTYGPTNYVSSPYPLEIVDTSPSGAYSIYNWELFFHIPFLIGTLLSQNQQFQDAKTWFEYIFNPTNDSNEPIPNRYWNFLYFNQNTLDGQIGDLLNALMSPGSPGYNQAYSQIQQWWNAPFDPDAVARLRPVAYEKAVVMAYIGNLIAWGDNLFSQNTRESINEATQLYVLADKILGPKPVLIPSEGTVLPRAYADLQWNPLDNALVQLENAFPVSISSDASNSTDSGSSVVASLGGPSTGPVPYFCTPVNSQLLSYWDTVADRLYKIRHCRNLQGQVQQLPLFSPPINPRLLIEAEAAGVDLSSVLNDINAAVPFYRFTFMLSKALELCAEVRSLGGALLSALEKKDAEALSLLRAGQELAVLEAMLEIKQNQINEAQANLQGLEDSLAITQAKQNYYQTLVSGGPMNGLETAQVTNLTRSQSLKESSQIAGLYGSELSLIPQFDIGAEGFGGTPAATFIFGGQQLSTMASMVAQAYSFQAEYYSFLASMDGLMAGWNRRFVEWQFQLETAGLEITQINDQINAANFRLKIAQEDLNNQNLQIGNAQAVENFLSNKFTNEDLYSWMIDQVSSVYFQCYQIVYDLAKRAEACYQFELGLSDSNFVQFGYWDSLKQGLLSGEKLYLDLKRMESAYLDQNKREYEITKSISLLLLDPLALITLKETGQCLVSLPEAYFDMDYPGHYMRRIKWVSLTIPCVTGPYTSVNCTLTLEQSKIRANTQSAGQGNPYLESPIGSDSRFFYNYAATQSIATSTGQNDSGMFEVNFRDERYLPFEGGGVISQWMISMPLDSNAFDFDTITDVILNLKYTARDGGTPFAALARAAATLPGPQLQTGISSPSVAFPKQSNLTRLFSLKHEFPTEWYQFMYPAPSATNAVLAIPLSNERFPFQYRGKKITISQAQLFLQFKAVYPPSVNSSSTPLADYGSSTLPVWLAPPSVTLNSSNGSLAVGSGLLGIPCASIQFSSPQAIYAIAAGQLVPWSLTINCSDIKSLAANLQVASSAGGGPFLNAVVIDDLFLVCQYSEQ